MPPARYRDRQLVLPLLMPPFLREPEASVSSGKVRRWLLTL